MELIREEIVVIKNFEEIKKQLGELVDIVNGFKSEQVQLRVVEAILANLGAPPPAVPKPEQKDEDGDEGFEDETEIRVVSRRRGRHWLDD